MGYVQSYYVQEVRTSDLEGLRCPCRAGHWRCVQSRAVSVSDDSGTCLQKEVVVLAMMNRSDGQNNRVVIVGGVAGGMSTATRLRRLDADVTITILERAGHVAFANCGLPYFVGGLIEEEEDLTLKTPEQLFDRFRLDVRVNQEVVAIDRATGTVATRSTNSDVESE